ncbi:hypothetical protein ACGFI9_18495 [Micromonospora sp. NPDC048930]|uniref:hypothetical protein n=1 Tax=Micromonospora sp. NPDC048930 TaxID=3364261 RepID=UPI00371F5C18
MAPGYGAPETPGYGAPEASYGAPASTAGAEAPRYGVPTPASGPGVPPAQAYGARTPTGYAGADTSAYPARDLPRYGAPEAPAHPTPQAGGHGTHGAPRYGPPTTSGPGGPATWPAPAPSGGHVAATGQPAAGGAEPAAGGYSSQAVQNQIRQAVVHRVQYANALHASHYWDLRRTKPVGPHALVFMYASLDPTFSNPRNPYYEIKAASRLFRDGADVQDLPALLHELTEIAKGYLADGRVFDPVAQMTQAAEPMPADATYVGIAVSTLLGTVDDIGGQPVTAVGGMGIPGRALVVLSDHNLLVVERPARAHEQVEVYSTFPYTTSGGVEYRSWRSFSQEQQAEPAWHWLQLLNQLVLAGQERKATATAAAGGGGRRRR